MAKPKNDEETYSEAETIRRSETTLKRMLNTPPTQHAPLKKKLRAKHKASRVSRSKA